MVRRTLPEALGQSGGRRAPVRWGVRRATGVLLAAVALAACTGGQGPPTHRLSPSVTSTASGTPAGGGTVTASCPAPPPHAQPAQGLPRYTLGVRLDLARGRVIGKESVTFTPDLPTGRLVFRLWPNAPPQAAEGAHLAVGQVESGDTALLGSFFPVLPWVVGQGWALDPPTTTLAEASTDPTADFDVTIRLQKGLLLPHGL